MAINTKAIKNRIKSVGNTKKITKAMEMVSAAKMRKSVEAALSTRAYAVMARELLRHLSKVEKKLKYELLTERPVKNLLVILISSNRGLCGSFNANIARYAALALKNILPKTDAKISIIGIGKKSADFARRNGYNLVAMYDNLSEAKSFDEILPISRMFMEEFKKSKYDKVVVAYTDYKSSLTQEPKIRQLLPVSAYEIEAMLSGLGRNVDTAKADPKEEIAIGGDRFSLDDYIFEPSEEEIIEYVLPRLVEVQLFQSVLESGASEHSARMMAMRTASDAARDMINELSLTFNKARQAAITQEIAEIAGGAAALE